MPPYQADVVEPSIVEPAAAAAAAKCLLARMHDDPATRGSIGKAAALTPRTFHPRPCEWEDFAPEVLVDMLAEFNAWAQNERGEWRDSRVLRFRSMTLRDQRRATYRAQYGEDPLVDEAPQQQESE